MSSNSIQTIEAEEIPIEQVVEKSLLTELEKLEITKKFLEEKRDDCMALKLNGQDKEAYTIIRETRLNMKTRRVAIEKICKKGREDATKTQKAWIAVEKDWTKIVSEGEDYLQKLEDEFESEKERIATEKKRKQDEAFILRQAELTKMGAQYVDGSFVLDGISYEAVLVKECDEDIWENTIKKSFYAQFLTNREKELLEQKRKADEEAALKRQAEEQDRRQKELEQREAAIKKAEEEQRRKEQEEIDRKAAEEKVKYDAKFKDRLDKMGYSFNGFTVSFNGNIIGSKADLMNIEDADFEIKYQEHLIVVAKEKEFAEQKRLADIEEQKRIAAEEAVKKERELAEKLQKEAELKRQQDEAKKAEDLAQASDKEKWADFLLQLNKLSIPDMRSGQFRKKITIAKEKLGEISEL